MHQNSPVNQPFLKFCAVEHCPHRAGVTGLLPVPPSITINSLRPFRRPNGQTPSGPRPPRTAAGSSRWSRVAEDHVEAGQGIAREELLNPAAQPADWRIRHEPDPDLVATRASPEKPLQHTQRITVAMIIGDDHVVSPDAGRHPKHGDDGVDPLEPQFRDQPTLASPQMKTGLEHGGRLDLPPGACEISGAAARCGGRR